jgi:hypothetical protein
MTTRNPGLDDIVNDALDEALAEVYTALPGVIQSYDSAAQKASVAPSHRVAHTDEQGRRVVQALPVVTGVPVVFPGGGGFTVTFPISPGDTVLLVFPRASLDKWKAGAGGSGAVDPEFYSSHPLANAVAIPGLRSFASARSSVPTDHVRIGVDGAAAQGAALGETLKDFLDDVMTYLAGHIHTGVTTGGGVSGPPATFPTAPSNPPTVPDVASDTVKVTE